MSKTSDNNKTHKCNTLQFKIVSLEKRAIMCKMFVDIISILETRRVNSFKIGMGSAFNLGGNYFSELNRPFNPGIDGQSIYSDWVQVGNDIRMSTNKFVTENQKLFTK
ncbi:MAG: hypothetical protein K8S16_12975 [Bacteroidales bacterium]|nr:hypothetical protein [Bacteroidales bacterium]